MSRSGRIKPNKGVLKRLRVTGKGRFKRQRAGASHLLSHKSGKKRRKLRGSRICPLCEEKRLRVLLHMPASRN